MDMETQQSGDICRQSLSPRPKRLSKPLTMAVTKQHTAGDSLSWASKDEEEEE